MTLAAVDSTLNIRDQQRLHTAVGIAQCSWSFAPLPLLLLVPKSSRPHLDVVGMLWFASKTSTSRACPLLLTLFLCLFLSLWPFQLYFIHKFSRQLSAFSLGSSGLNSAVLVLSGVYILMKVSLSPGIILCG